MDNLLPKKSRCVWGETCFAEYRSACDTEVDQPWTVQKYDTDWYFCLDNEADALELMRRLDARAARHALAPGI